MNTWADAFSRPASLRSPLASDVYAWRGATAFALAITTLALLTVPGALVAPAIAVVLFLGSIVPVAATRNAAPARRDQARLFASMVFAIGILASVLTDLDRVVTYLR